MPTIKRRSASSGSSLNKGTVNRNRGQGEASGRIKKHSPMPIIGLLKVDEGLCSVRVR